MYTIKVTRLNKVFGFAITFRVFVDGEELGRVGNGKTIECTVKEAGEHTVTIKSVEEDFNQIVTLNDNQNEVEIFFSVSMGLIAGRPNVKEIKYSKK